MKIRQVAPSIAKIMSAVTLNNLYSFLSDGVFTIGEKMSWNSTNFDPKSFFHGVITRFNIWDEELDNKTVNEYSTFCGEEEGNIIAWPEVKLSISGEVEIVEGDDCFPGRYQALQKYAFVFVGT